jgi:hypothetical protein
MSDVKDSVLFQAAYEPLLQFNVTSSGPNLGSLPQHQVARTTSPWMEGRCKLN